MGLPTTFGRVADLIMCDRNDGADKEMGKALAPDGACVACTQTFGDNDQDSDIDQRPNSYDIHHHGP